MARKGVSLLSSLKEEVAQAAEKTEDLILFDEMLPTKPLTAQQESFVRYYVDDGMSLSGAARKAGFSNGTMVMKGAAVRRAVELRREEYAAASRVSKKRVVDGMLEAIEAAKLKADPAVMVAGWKEIGRLCGHYEPTKTQIEVSVNGQVMLQKMTAMSDEELLRLASEDAVDADVIEAGDE